MSESSATPPATNESEAREVEAREVEAREVDPAVGESAVGESRPGGAGVVAALALILLGLTLWSAYQLMSYADNTALATTQAALVLPQIVAVTLIAGAAAGVLTVGWLGVRLGDGRSWVPRAAAGAIGGLVVGLLSMGGVLAAYHHGSSVAAVAITTAITGVAGGAHRRHNGRARRRGRRLRVRRFQGVLRRRPGHALRQPQYDRHDGGGVLPAAVGDLDRGRVRRRHHLVRLPATRRPWPTPSGTVRRPRRVWCSTTSTCCLRGRPARRG